MIYCPKCKLEVDDTESQNTCTRCGDVVQSNVSHVLPGWETGRTNHVQSKSKKKTSSSFLAGEKALNKLFQLYNTPENLRATATAMFEKIDTSKKFQSVDKKVISAACCLFIAMRVNNQPAISSSFCSQVGCPSQNAEDLVAVILCDFPKEERAKLVKKTQLLVKLCDECWTTVGKSPEHVVVAAAFCCYRSIYKHERLSLENFMKDYNFKGSQVRKHVTEMKALILKLAKSFKDYDMIDKVDVFFHLDYVLENSSSLRTEQFYNSNLEALDSFEFKEYRKPVKQRPHAVKGLGEVVTGNEDISDSEVSKYILTEEEAQNLNAFIKIAEDGKEDDEL